MLVQYCRTNTTREWLDTTRTSRTGHETMVYGSYRSRKYPVEPTIVTCISLVRQHFNEDSATVKQWFTSRTIAQFRYIKIQPKTIDLSTRLVGINPTNSVVIPTEPRAEVFCFRLNFNISKLGYW